MKIDKKELKKISLDFRSLASRVINANFNEIASIIRMYVSYIEQKPLLIDYINSCPMIVDGEQIRKDAQEVANSCGQKMLSKGATTAEEIAYIFVLLKIVSAAPELILGIGYTYCHSNHLQKCAKAFGDYVVLPFCNNINTYLTHIGIDMGMDETNTYNITVNGGQFNLSQDNSSISAIQNNNGLDSGKVQTMISEILEIMHANAVAIEQQQEIKESLNGIQEELQKTAPKKSMINMLLNGLKSSAALLSAIPEISQKINLFAEYIAPFIS